MLTCCGAEVSECDEVRNVGKGRFCCCWPRPTLCGDALITEEPPDRPAPLAGGNSCCCECTMPCGCIATKDSVEVRLCACMFFAFEEVPLDSSGPCIVRLLMGT